MIHSIASLQFVFVSLGLLMVHLGMKVASSPGSVPPLERILVSHGVFLFLIPALWLVFANFVMQGKSPKFSEGFVRAIGIGITIVIGGIFVVPVVRLIFLPGR